jgi:hypothetical protein
VASEEGLCSMELDFGNILLPLMNTVINLGGIF